MADELTSAVMPPVTPLSPAQAATFSVEHESRAAFWDWINAIKPLILNGAGAAIISAGAVWASAPLTVAIAAAVGGSLILREIGEIKGYSKNLTHMYRDTIGKVVGKDPHQVTIEDMEYASDPDKVGDRAIKPLQLERGSLAHLEKCRVVSAGIRTLVSLAVALGGATLMPMIDPTFTAKEMLIGLASTTAALDAGMQTIAYRWRQETAPPSLYMDLKRMSEVASRRAITPNHTLGIMLKVLPEEHKKIKQQYGKHFFELPYQLQHTITASLEPDFQAMALTNGINTGILQPNAIAFTALGQPESLPVNLKSLAPQAPPTHSPTTHMAPHNVSQFFTAMINDQRLQLANAERSIH